MQLNIVETVNSFLWSGEGVIHGPDDGVSTHLWNVYSETTRRYIPEAVILCEIRYTSYFVLNLLLDQCGFSGIDFENTLVISNIRTLPFLLISANVWNECYTGKPCLLFAFVTSFIKLTDKAGIWLTYVDQLWLILRGSVNNRLRVFC
jgi:hypothetical protein